MCALELNHSSATPRARSKQDEVSLTLLASYPRIRPPLTPGHESRYVEEYRRNRSSKGGLFATTAFMESWMHRTIANGNPGSRILELGAGTLNHINYESPTGVYDVVEPFRALWEDSPHRGRVTTFYEELGEIPDDHRYDRILSIAVLEHLTDLPKIVARCGRLLAKDGQFQAGIPTEGGTLWGLAWRTTTGVAYRLRTGLSYATVMQHEHVNTADEILAITRYFFTEVGVRRFPAPLKHFSFYSVIEASRPRLTRCAEHAGLRVETAQS
jgi:SAM-dependent methyltransferase